MFALAYIAVLIAQASTAPTPLQSYDHNVEMDEDGKFHLFWSLEKESITFEVHAKTVGWVGLGFSTTGGMTGADFVVGWVKDDGTAVMYDLHARNESKGFIRPAVDSKQNVELLGGKRNSGSTVLQFRRKYETCDEDDMVINTGTIRVLFAFSNELPTSIHSFAYHSSRGQKSLGLRSAYIPPQMPADAMTFELGQIDVKIPQRKTTYWCRIIKLQNFGGPVHVIRFEPNVDKENLAIVHHIVIYTCGVDLSDDMHNYGYNCFGANMPNTTGMCSVPFIAWGVGGGAFDLPVEAGIPLGGPNDPRFVVIETHYDNPNLLPGHVDNSALRMTYTRKLRKNDAVTMTIGRDTSKSLMIPPGIPLFRSRAYCSSTCLSAGMIEQGVSELTVIASFLHAHLLGVALRMRHIRNGVELEPIAADEHYDFNFQETRKPIKEFKIKLGDELIVECDYNSLDRDEITYGGLASSQEMCFNFLLYYPALQMAMCQSNPVLKTQMRSECLKTQGEESLIIEPKAYVGRSIYEVFWTGNKTQRYKYDWNDERKQVFQAQDSQEYWQTCRYFNGSSLDLPPPPNLENYSYDPPVMKTPYVPVTKCPELQQNNKPRGLNKEEVEKKMKLLCPHFYTASKGELLKNSILVNVFLLVLLKF